MTKENAGGSGKGAGVAQSNMNKICLGQRLELFVENSLPYTATSLSTHTIAYSLLTNILVRIRDMNLRHRSGYPDFGDNDPCP